MNYNCASCEVTFELAEPMDCPVCGNSLLASPLSEPAFLEKETELEEEVVEPTFYDCWLSEGLALSEPVGLEPLPRPHAH